ncbi:hypothetical protein SNEBB_010494 [Seison nebaliae]|nr:hypothetical protein SNEBB_010494 [Seison nebaliae]
MGKFNISTIKYMNNEQFRILIGIEMGMKNHEIVSPALLSILANVHDGISHKTLRELLKFKLIAYEKNKRVSGYRLTFLGYDHLALRALSSSGTICAVGNQLGVGKESDIYNCLNEHNEQKCMKIHRLGRTSFRQLKNKRDYLGKRKSFSWIYMSRLSCKREYACLKVLDRLNFPVPKPVDYNRHIIIMELLMDYVPLSQVQELGDASITYYKCMRLIEKFAVHGLIHGDFNEFNIMIKADDQSDIIVIDFPQMLSVQHPNAKSLFDRDVSCICQFFRRRFSFESDDIPQFEEIDYEKESELVKNLKLTKSLPIRNSDDDNDEDEEDEEDEENDEEVRPSERNYLPDDEGSESESELTYSHSIEVEQSTDLMRNLRLGISSKKDVTNVVEHSGETDEEDDDQVSEIQSINRASLNTGASLLSCGTVTTATAKSRIKSKHLVEKKRLLQKRLRAKVNKHEETEQKRDNHEAINDGMFWNDTIN